MYPDVYLLDVAQFQTEGKINYLTVNPGFEKYANSKNYIPPANLRK